MGAPSIYIPTNHINTLKETQVGLFKRLKTSKTLYATLMGLGLAVMAYFEGALPLMGLIKIGFEAAAVIFIRDGIAKQGVKNG